MMCPQISSTVSRKEVLAFSPVGGLWFSTLGLADMIEFAIECVDRFDGPGDIIPSNSDFTVCEEYSGVGSRRKEDF